MAEYTEFIWAWPDILSSETPVLRWTFWLPAGHFTVKLSSNMCETFCSTFWTLPWIFSRPWSTLPGHFVPQDQTPLLDIFQIPANFAYTVNGHPCLTHYITLQYYLVRAVSSPDQPELHLGKAGVFFISCPNFVRDVSGFWNIDMMYKFLQFHEAGLKLDVTRWSPRFTQGGHIVLLVLLC